MLCPCTHLRRKVTFSDSAPTLGAIPALKYAKIAAGAHCGLPSLMQALSGGISDMGHKLLRAQNRNLNSGPFRQYQRSWYSAAVVCACIWSTPSVFAQVTGTVTGSVTSSYSSNTDQNGNTTYSFVNASANLSVDLPIIPAVATTAIGSHYWSNPLTWG